jgi:hypothetical protein
VPNLPGLPLCVDCGLDLNAEPEAPASFVPTAAVANPLREKRARPRRPRPPIVASGFEHVGRVRQLPWQAFGQGVLGLITGAVPGLMPATRREWRVAGIEAGLFLAALLFALVVGGVPEGLARFSWLVALCWSIAPASECQRRMNVPQPFRFMTAFWLVMGPVVVITLALPALVRGSPAPLFRYSMTQSLLVSGSYRIDDDDLESLRSEELVLLDRGDHEARREAFEARMVRAGLASPTRRSQLGARYMDTLLEFEVFPVVIVALEGQELGWADERLTVSGVPSQAVPVHVWTREPLAAELLGSAVPAEHVAVWDWIPHPSERSLHVSIVHRDLLMGRLTQRSRGADSFEPVPWPPADLDVEDYL